jgi:type IV conjugative transfer system protein TraE
MSDKKPPPYLDVVANAFKTAQAWRTATLVVSAVAVMLAFALVSSARNTPVVLVPEALATSGERMTVTTNGEIRGTSNEYVANVAMGDLSLILNFTPENVVTQHKRFLNRVTDDLYVQQKEALLAQANQLKKDNLTQSFFPSEVRVAPEGNRAVIQGTQIRYVAGKEMQRVSLTYVISYKVYKGYMHVADLHQETSAK